MIRFAALLLASILFAMLGAQLAKPWGVSPLILGLVFAYFGQLVVKLDHFLTYWEIYLKTKNELIEVLKQHGKED